MSAKKPPQQSETVPDETPPEGSDLEQTLRQAAERAGVQADAAKEQPAIPRGEKDPDEMPGMRQNTNLVDWEPIRVDDNGLVWYQEEVLKPAFAKPRGRRVLTYTTGETTTLTSRDSEGMTETFEVAGEGPRHTEQAKITLPSYQVGMYRDPRYPFMVHVYNEKRGFDLFEVQAYYGGAELVPTECKRTYVENVLCYDMRTVIRAIQTEYRQLQLSGRVD